MANIRFVPKSLYSGNETRQKLLNGINAVYDKVAPTISAKGRHILFTSNDLKAPVKIVNDGISIAEQVQLEDELENAGAWLTTQACKATEVEAGDSTSQTASFIKHLFERAVLEIDKKDGINPRILSKQMRKAVDMAVELLQEKSNKTDKVIDLIDTATISCREREWAEIIVEAVENIGEFGVVKLLQDFNGKDKDYIEYDEGYLIEVGSNSSHLFNQNGFSLLQNCFTLLIDGNLNKFDDKTKDILRELDTLSMGNYEHKPHILIIANEFGQEFERFAMKLKDKGTFIQLVRTPGVNPHSKIENLKDLQSLLGGNIITLKNYKLDSVVKYDFGYADLIEVHQYQTHIQKEIDSITETSIDKRIFAITEELNDKEITNTFNKESALKERIAKLKSKVAKIMLSSVTEVDFEDKFQRYKDALNTVRKAKIYGISRGGGVDFKDTAMELDKKIKKKSIGDKIVINALYQPMRIICKNGGYEWEYITSNGILEQKGVGINVETEKIGDMWQLGVLDSTHGLKQALLNSFAVVEIMMLIEGGITEK